MAYDPNSEISVRAVLKLEEYAGIQVLKKLMTRLDKLKKRAGFSMSRKSLPLPNMYNDISTAKCIMSWVEDKQASCPPTWSNFFKILREQEMNLCDIANQIERYLISTAENHAQEEHNSEFILLHV